MECNVVPGRLPFAVVSVDPYVTHGEHKRFTFAIFFPESESILCSYLISIRYHSTIDFFGAGVRFESRRTKQARSREYFGLVLVLKWLKVVNYNPAFYAYGMPSFSNVHF